MVHEHARRKARTLVDAYDGSAETIVEKKVDQSLAAGDISKALEFDQTRREIRRIYSIEGK